MTEHEETKGTPAPEENKKKTETEEYVMQDGDAPITSAGGGKFCKHGFDKNVPKKDRNYSDRPMDPHHPEFGHDGDLSKPLYIIPRCHIENSMVKILAIPFAEVCLDNPKLEDMFQYYPATKIRYEADWGPGISDATRRAYEEEFAGYIDLLKFFELDEEQEDGTTKSYQNPKYIETTTDRFFHKPRPEESHWHGLGKSDAHGQPNY